MKHNLPNKLRLAAIAAAAALASAASTAAPVAFDEASGGDLIQGSTGSLLTVFPFEVGVNTVSGTIGSSGDADGFGFTVPTGTQLTSGTVQLADAGGNFLYAAWYVRSGSLLQDSGDLVGFLSPNSPGSDALAGVPLGAGEYNVSESSFGTAGAGSLADYTFTFTLASINAVPEPGTLALVGLAGVAALATRRRRTG